ncbi:alpha-1,3-galactosyltransferase 2-like isoform X2 [Epinephelus moara]|uniref:alpha-1,3-galactosyltransferase 2-like isoform X2 n=1 Tax=Epinephelus moara TaxID=300413 RepID=UPI00214F15C1|nr:alpha-1,3-galactosyltransferase 2-like isoform X2 [Epinephelus moara]
MSWLKTWSARTFCCLVLLVISFTSLYLRHLATLSPAKNLPVASEGEQRQIINLAKALKLRQLTTLVPVDNPPVASKGEQRQSINVDDTLNFGARPQVATRTSWNAPIIWEGMFDPNLYDQQHIERNSTVALTVFAVGRYLDAYLKTFLTTAEQHFMLGLQVTYYVFTDQPEKVPNIDLGPKRSLKVMSVEKHSRWQDISMMRMKTISDTIESEIRHHCRYVFCFDVDQVFKGRFGSEALGDSVALLHAWFYKLPKNRFTYDRNPKSKAFMETGDYYYHAAVFGGLLENVKNLADFCFLGIMEDKGNNVEALWHDESHLNKYFWLHKPSRLLSPEYCWDQIIGKNTDIRVQRLIWAPKQYNKLRTR